MEIAGGLWKQREEYRRKGDKEPASEIHLLIQDTLKVAKSQYKAE